jgi:hypothetical protein
MLVELAIIYSADFSSHDCCLLVDELNIYVDVMKRTPEFIACDTLRKRYLHKLMTRRLCFVFMPTVTVEDIFLMDFDSPAWNQLNGMIISPQNVALLYLVFVF